MGKRITVQFYFIDTNSQTSVGLGLTYYYYRYGHTIQCTLLFFLVAL